MVIPSENRIATGYDTMRARLSDIRSSRCSTAHAAVGLNLETKVWTAPASLALLSAVGHLVCILWRSRKCFMTNFASAPAQEIPKAFAEAHAAHGSRDAFAPGICP